MSRPHNPLPPDQQGPIGHQFMPMVGRPGVMVSIPHGERPLSGSTVSEIKVYAARSRANLFAAVLELTLRVNKPNYEFGYVVKARNALATELSGESAVLFDEPANPVSKWGARKQQTNNVVEVQPQTNTVPSIEVANGESVEALADRILRAGIDPVRLVTALTRAMAQAA